MKVNILMSTYQGQAFLAEQIESIRSQTFEDWHLLIRDDGSDDRTPEIIREFVRKDSRIRFINDGQAENCGVINSFYALVKEEAADYYFFSDQDDVWLPDKLALQLAEAEKHPKDRALLIYTDLKVVDQELNIMAESMIRSQSHHANTSLKQELTENTVTGGTMLINHALAQLWTETKNLIMHDWYLALLAAAFGQLIYIDQPTELYRQHDSNVLGARTLSKRLRNWLQPHKLVRKYWWLIGSSQQQASRLLSLNLPEAEKSMVQDYIHLMEQPLSSRISLLRRHGFAKNRAFHTFIFKLLIISKFGYRRNL